MPKSLTSRLQASSIASLLEVVAEGEVAEHLEEGVVARGVADVVEVVVLAAGAHALLRGRRRVVGARLLAGEHVLELHHAGVGEHERGIVARHKRRRRHDLMALLLEEIEERSADLVDARHRIAFGKALGAAPRGPHSRFAGPIRRGSDAFMSSARGAFYRFGQTFAVSRHLSPSLSKSEGARAPNDRHPFCNAGSLSAPAAVRLCMQVEGAKHIRGRAFGPTRHSRRAIVVPGPRAAALCQLRFELGRRSRRAAVQSITGVAQPRTPAPAL